MFYYERTRSTPLDPKLIFLVHLGPFVCHMEAGAKRAKLVQKFVPRSRNGIFRNERTHPPHWTLI